MTNIINVQVHLIKLLHHFIDTIHIPKCPSGIGSSSHNGIYFRPIVLSIFFCNSFQLCIHIKTSSSSTSLFTSRPKEIVQKNISILVVIDIFGTCPIFQEYVTFHSQLGTSSSSLSSMIRLCGTLRHDILCTLLQGFGHEPFQLPRLIPSSSQSSTVITLDINLHASQCFTKPWTEFQGSRQVRQSNPRELFIEFFLTLTSSLCYGRRFLTSRGP
mmetsp:Transcript_16428/g.31125  ORF Transcript_16428/g.31125 Transcript_16428/m.31125 type:complete len:215 (+) Transcript_16428:4652-5296(+)